MEFNLKNLLIGSAFIAGIAFGGYKAFFGGACCSAIAETSGCTPSNCRGAQTKFGEAQVISDLRLNLIDLKSEMEQSKSPSFDEKSYDIHGIIGDSDEESLEIIVKQVQLVEEAFVEKLNHQPTAFALPDNKAKQISYLNTRIESLQKLL